MKPDDLSQSLPTATFSKFCTFQSFKNIKAKRGSDYHSESTQHRDPRNFENFNEIFCDEAFNKIVDTHYLCKNQNIPTMISCNILKVFGAFGSIVFYRKVNQMKACLKNCHTKSSDIKSRETNFIWFQDQISLQFNFISQGMSNFPT